MPELRDALPALYRVLLGPPLDAEVPAETKATCARCAMLEEHCERPVRPVDGVPRFFRPDTKCCTFHPRLPNYLVGAILADDRPEAAEGRRRIEARVASRVGVTPEWLHPPRTFHLLYDASHRAFGRSRALRCPYYAEESGGCSIWAHRDAVCSTWFCQHASGADGRRMWMAVKELLSLVEVQLARRALLEVFPAALDEPPGRRAPSPVGPEELDGAPPPEAEHRAVWGPWAGREAELYRRCHAVVSGIGARELEAILGLDGTIARRQLARAVEAARSTALPPVLKLDPGATVQWLPDGSVALGGYSEHEAVALPGEAHALLVRFTGDATVAAVRARLRAELHADLDDAVLLELYRQRVLVEPGSPAR
ncbi:hypothetical protein [Anaeromyxobacter terrae]|uniref:hypothetical protein n=1 Tax=Anaeromyxobacter terrae TaxID=2925406 RepID=UPI001F5A82B3|nr:hypothetical protein [Anaeromyxobacter sp. SG22]